MKYRLLAIDMDGTTLNSKHEISNETLNTINRLKKDNVIILIVTGRMYSSAFEISKKLNLNTPISSYNGAKIHDEKGNLIYKKEISENIIKKLVSLPDLKKNNVLPLFFIDEKLVVPWKDKNLEEYENRTGIKAEIDENILKKEFISTKFLLSSENYSYLSVLKEIIKKELGSKVYLTNSMKRYVEVLNPEVSKGNAIKYLVEKFNVPLSQCVVIGDNNNDIGMFMPEVYKVAMGNATSKLKEKADFVTITNDEDGVSYAVKKIFYGE